MRRTLKGFTLLEILLVLAIASSLMVLLLNYSTQKSDELRRDKTVLQMQQILNAGLSFYLTNSYWPLTGASITQTQCGTTTWTDISTLQPNYIPSALINNSYANPYQINCNNAANGGGFFVYTTVNTPANAAIIAGRLPLAFITTPASLSGSLPPAQPSACLSAPYTGCTVVVASVNIPGQNLNNARSVNFASVYHNGACVPAPNCPPNMKPAIFVTPTGVTGIVDDPTCSNANDPTTCTNIKTYPLTSFVAFARGGNLTTGDPASSIGSGASIQSAPYDCATVNTSTPVNCDMGSNANDPAGTKYWRVCLVVFTQNGEAIPLASYSQANNMGKLIGTIMAFTRCVPNSGTEAPAGSPITVWTPNNNNVP